ncbi:hypothetical protein GYMLUDRAFT_49181 [Collybiopsis luxurians FD-317 M1]|uniref:Mid2 domain-containing protein n=1 Tax=Collybiopsis luxurians FD-317 M1 TaxID=944289 RepID=A0A0D0BW55_9AGAR|nr:hypothetical protein GYMLUDRAFT_49181 [Collybiopsis luxurians FD-317 M1]
MSPNISLCCLTLLAITFTVAAEPNELVSFVSQQVSNVISFAEAHQHSTPGDQSLTTTKSGNTEQSSTSPSIALSITSAEASKSIRPSALPTTGSSQIPSSLSEKEALPSTVTVTSTAISSAGLVAGIDTDDITSSLSSQAPQSAATVTSIGLNSTAPSSSSMAGQEGPAPPPVITAQASLSKKSNLGTIIGGSVGGIIFIALLALIVLILWDKRRRRRKAALLSRATFYGDFGDLMVQDRAVAMGPQGAASDFGSFAGYSDTSRFGFVRRFKSIASSKYTYPISEKWGRFSPSLVGGASRISEEKDHHHLYGDGDDDGKSESDVPCLSSSVSADTHTNTQHGIRSSDDHSNLPRLSYPYPRTDRQMQVEQKINDLRSRLISLNDGLKDGAGMPEAQTFEMRWARAMIKRLEELQFSDWALERTDVLPSEILKQLG